MRVAVVSESFLPQVNGVTNTVCQVVDRLVARGHEPLVIAPGAGPTQYAGAPVVRVRSLELPRYRSFPLGVPDLSVDRHLAAFRPDIVHLASPIVLGAAGLRGARRLGVPTVAVYQTDVAGFAQHYGLRVDPLVRRWVGRLHRRATRTLAPSFASCRQLEALGVRDVHLWRRGIATDVFSPDRRDESLRRRWLRDDATTVIGYVGRLAAEKQVGRLAELGQIPGTRLVVVGDGPQRASLERALPNAVFTGMLRGPELAAAFASLDVFVHTGESETFCQTVQEAQASGVPVVAPGVGGPVDLIDHRETGMLFPAGHLGLMRSHVAELASQPLLRHRLAASALTVVRRRTWPRVVDHLIDVHYQDLVYRGTEAAA